MIVDETVRSVSHPDVYGVGDAAAVRVRRPGAADGVRDGAADRADGGPRDRGTGGRPRTPKPMRFRYVNQCISLGRRDGLIQFVHADDSPREAVLTGRVAALYKELVVRIALSIQRHPGLPSSF